TWCMKLSRARCSRASDRPFQEFPMTTNQLGTEAYGPFVPRRRAISRRRFLKATGIAMALPFLDSMVAPFSRVSRAAAALAPNAAPRRMFAVCNNLGLLKEGFFPKDAGRDYALSPYLKLLEEHRKDFTVFTGVSHPQV